MYQSLECVSHEVVEAVCVLLRWDAAYRPTIILDALEDVLKLLLSTILGATNNAYLYSVSMSMIPMK